MERYRQNRAGKRPALGVEPAKLLIRPAKQILVRNSPGAAKRRIDEIFFFDESVNPVSEKEGAHLIENTLATVKKERRVSALFEYAGERSKTPARLRPLDHPRARQRREGRYCCLQRLNRPLAGGVASFEQHSFGRQFIQLRRQRRLTAETTDQPPSETFHHHQYNVERLVRSAPLDMPDQRVRRIVRQWSLL